MSDELSSRGGFFAVDRRTWARACSLGSITAPVAYLVMASGALRDHRTTAWSVNAIEKYTGIGRHTAKTAIAALTEAGLVRKTQGGSRPRYFLEPAHEVPGCEGFPLPVPTEQSAQKLLADLRALKPDRCFVLPKNNRDRFWADRLVEAGLAQQDGNEFSAIPYDAEAAARPDWVWLPQACIDGVAGETAPIEYLRQSHNLTALRLFVELYHVQSLAQFGGVSWRVLRQQFTRQRMGERGAYVVWGFVRKNEQAFASIAKPYLIQDPNTGDASWVVFWAALNLILSLGLAEYVGHVIEADTAEASVIFPYAFKGGEPEEQAIAKAAHAAGLRMLIDGKVALANATSMHLVPLRRHYEQPALVGLLRMRYQPRTEVTAEWISRKPEWAAMARELGAIGVPANMQHQMKIKS